MVQLNATHSIASLRPRASCERYDRFTVPDNLKSAKGSRPGPLRRDRRVDQDRRTTRAIEGVSRGAPATTTSVAWTRPDPHLWHVTTTS